MHNDAQKPASSSLLVLVLTFSLFALWGLGHRLYDTLLPQFATVFGLRSFELALTQSVFLIVYVVGAIPAALYARYFGYKAGIIFGLGVFSLGAFVLYPAAEMRAFSYFLTAVAVMSCGWICLEVSANPLAASLGTHKSFVQRLNLAQCFYPLGALIGILSGQWIVDANLALPVERAAHAITHPYIVIGAGVLLLAFLIDDARFPALATARTRGLNGVGPELGALFARPLFVFAIVAQFFGILALAGLWAPTGRFFDLVLPGGWTATNVDVVVWSSIILALGRLVGTALMWKIEPERLLAAFAAGGVLLTAVCAEGGRSLGLYLVLAGSFLVSIVWPTILGLAIRDLGPQMKLGTAFICMGGALGGIAYTLLNVVWPSSSFRLAMTVPALSFAVVLAYAVVCERARRPVQAPTAGRSLANS